MSDRVIVLFLQFIEPADRFHGFLAGAFLSFIVISINNRKADAAMRVWGFFKIHNKYSVSYNTYYITKRYKTLVKYDEISKIKKLVSRHTKGFQAINEHMLLQNCGV